MLRKTVISIIVTIIVSISVLSIGVTAADEDVTYKYSPDFAPLSELFYQDFEESEVNAEPITSGYPQYANAHIYGFFSFIVDGSKVKVTDENPISGDQSLVLSDFLDARTWMIHTLTTFDSSAYSVEFKVRIDSMPEEGGRFALKITDLNSVERDNEDSGNPIIYFQTVEGKLGLYNLTNKHLADLEIGKTYSITVACDLETTDYYVFVDGEYLADSKSEFNVEFSTLSAIRFDILGEGIQVTLDDLCMDGGLIKKVSTATPAPTQAPTTAPTAAPTQAPTQAPADSEGGCGSSVALAQIMMIMGAALIIKKRK